MFGEPAPGVLEEGARSWKPKGYLAWLEAKTLVRGRYELLGYVGSGSVGSVFVARHIGFDETVALKFLQPRYLASPDTASSFMREARAGFKLRSEHIARVFDVDVHEEVPFIATEMLDGETLRHRLKQRGALAQPCAVDYVLQACEALACAHALGALHLDIEPENLFLLGDEHIKLVDFGISQLAPVESSPALRYTAPERIRGATAPDARADIWSLGCVLYELLSGRAAFGRSSVLATCAAVLEEEPAELTQLPEGLREVLARCLRKSPDARFADVAELAAQLAPFGSGRYSEYPERCRAQLDRDSTAPAAPEASSASASAAASVAVSVRQTMVLGPEGAIEEPRPASTRPSSRKATLAFDVSAFASAEEAVRELDATDKPDLAKEAAPLPDAVDAPQPDADEALVREMRTALPSGMVMLMAALVCMVLGGFALLSAPPKQSELPKPKLMHLVTPLQK